jgi:uncharacterized UBP type Zn finger protein
MGKLQEALRNLLPWFLRRDKGCPHLGLIRDVTPSALVCEDCLKIGDTWVHLRLCLICGHVGCCDQSRNKHATQHYHATGHPIVRSLEPGETWRWCYVDQVLLPQGGRA